MQEIIIDPEFKKLLPELDSETFAWLEESLLEYGCMNPLVLWNGILIDGHNRYEIIKKHDLPFNTISMEFDSRDDVFIWIISTQISRRNLNQVQLSYYRGLHYNTDKRIVTNMTGNNQYREVVPHSEGQPKERHTATRLAEHYNVSRATIERDSQFATALGAIGEISPEAKRRILSGSAGILLHLGLPRLSRGRLITDTPFFRSELCHCTMYNQPFVGRGILDAPPNVNTG